MPMPARRTRAGRRWRGRWRASLPTPQSPTWSPTGAPAPKRRRDSAGRDDASVSPLVRRYLRTAIGFLLAGLGLGTWMLIRRELAGDYPTPRLISAHTHVIMVGFVMMMILGVALW